MITSVATILIEQPIERLWPLLGSPLRMADYHPLFTGSETLVGGGVSVGDCIRWHYKLKKRTGHYDEEITHIIPGKLIQTENRGGENIPPFSRAITTLELKENGDNKTTVTLRVEIALKSRVLQKLFGWQVRRGYRKFLPKILDALKDYSEADTLRGAIKR